MSVDLKELVEFLHHGNTPIRQIATENLLGYSVSQPQIFKVQQLLPIKDLKLLIRDYAPIAKNATTILINLSAHDEEVVQNLAEDSLFIESLLKLVIDGRESYVHEACMLLANLTKSSASENLIHLKRTKPLGKDAVSNSEHAVDQLIDCLIKVVPGQSAGTYDYLSYVFADLSRHISGRKYFTTKQKYDDVVPVTKLLALMDEHSSEVRRKGVASAVKNVCFVVDAHSYLLSEVGANILPYILLPIAGSEELGDDDMEGMLPDLQLLPSDKKREPDLEILAAHLETLLLLTTTREGRDLMRKVKVYPIIRECHLHVEDENAREACDRLVQVLQRDEAEDVEEDKGRDDAGGDEDMMVTEVF